MIDLMFLSKLPKAPITEDNKIIKYIQKEGTEPIPKNSRIYFSYKQYDCRGEQLKSHNGLLFRENQHCEGMCLAIRSMSKCQKAWFKIAEEYLGGKEGQKLITQLPKQSSYFSITIEDSKLKFDDNSTIQDRIDVFNQNKAFADAAFSKGNYPEAAKHYSACINNFSNLPKKLQRTEDAELLIVKGLNACKRNFALTVVKGELVAEQQLARERINSLVNEDRSAKNLYIQGRLLLQMKYIGDARKVLVESYKLDSNPETLKLIDKTKAVGNKEKVVCKHIINNMEAERVEESKRKKREVKDEWFLQADKEAEKRLLIERAISTNEFDPDKLNMIDDWNM